MSVTSTETKVETNKPKAPSRFKSCVWVTWKGWVFVLCFLNLTFILMVSALILYDADTYIITPMMPDADERTACDANYVCQGLRAALYFYAFTILFIGSSALYLFLSKAHLVCINFFPDLIPSIFLKFANLARNDSNQRKMIHIGILLFNLAHTCTFGTILHLFDIFSSL